MLDFYVFLALDLMIIDRLRPNHSVWVGFYCSATSRYVCKKHLLISPHPTIRNKGTTLLVITRRWMTCRKCERERWGLLQGAHTLYMCFCLHLASVVFLSSNYSYLCMSYIFPLIIEDPESCQMFSSLIVKRAFFWMVLYNDFAVRCGQTSWSKQHGQKLVDQWE